MAFVHHNEAGVQAPHRWRKTRLTASSIGSAEQAVRPFIPATTLIGRMLLRCRLPGLGCAGVCRFGVKQGHLVCDDQPDLECTWNVKESLQLVEIYFDTPTFDRITKDAKTNGLTKISMIGGTLGLFLGRAFIANDRLFHYLGET